MNINWFTWMIFIHNHICYLKIGGNKNSPDYLNIMVNYHYHQTPGRTHPVRGQYKQVSRLTTGTRPNKNHQRHSDGGGRTTIQRIRASGGGLGEPPALAPVTQSCKQVIAADGSGLHIVAR